MGGIDYLLISGTKEEIQLAMPNWLDEPAGTYPPYNEGVRVHEVEVLEQGKIPPHAARAVPNTKWSVRLVEGPIGERGFAFYDDDLPSTMTLDPSHSEPCTTVLRNWQSSSSTMNHGLFCGSKTLIVGLSVTCSRS